MWVPSLFVSGMRLCGSTQCGVVIYQGLHNISYAEGQSALYSVQEKRQSQNVYTYKHAFIILNRVESWDVSSLGNRSID